MMQFTSTSVFTTIATAALIAASMSNNVAVMAFPNGSPSCISGAAAVTDTSVGTSHVENGKVQTTTEVFDSNYNFMMQSAVITDGVNLEIKPGTYPISITGTDDATFKGVMIRVRGNAGSFLLSSNDDDSRTVSQCSSEEEAEMNLVRGLTHTSSSEKTTLGGTLELLRATPLYIEVTVVVANNATHSEYYYSVYDKLAVVTEFQDVPTTPLPTVPPLPTPAPTTAPAAGGVQLDAPVAADSASEDASEDIPAVNRTNPESADDATVIDTPVALNSEEQANESEGTEVKQAEQRSGDNSPAVSNTATSLAILVVSIVVCMSA